MLWTKCLARLTRTGVRGMMGPGNRTCVPLKEVEPVRARLAVVVALLLGILLVVPGLARGAGPERPVASGCRWSCGGGPRGPPAADSPGPRTRGPPPALQPARRGARLRRGGLLQR